MKITQSQLRKLIKEELKNALNENDDMEAAQELASVFQQSPRIMAAIEQALEDPDVIAAFEQAEAQEGLAEGVSDEYPSGTGGPDFKKAARAKRGEDAAWATGLVGGAGGLALSLGGAAKALATSKAMVALGIGGPAGWLVMALIAAEMFRKRKEKYAEKAAAKGELAGSFQINDPEQWPGGKWDREYRKGRSER